MTSIADHCTKEICKLDTSHGLPEGYYLFSKIQKCHIQLVKDELIYLNITYDPLKTNTKGSRINLGIKDLVLILCHAIYLNEEEESRSMSNKEKYEFKLFMPQNTLAHL